MMLHKYFLKLIFTWVLIFKISATNSYITYTQGITLILFQEKRQKRAIVSNKCILCKIATYTHMHLSYKDN